MGGPGELVPIGDIELPAPLGGVLELLGLRWPTTSESELFRVGGVYLRLAGMCSEARITVDVRSTEMLVVNRSPAIAAFALFHARLAGPTPPAHMAISTLAASAVGGSFLAAGAVVAGMKLQLILILLRAAVGIALTTGATSIHPGVGAALGAVDQVTQAALKACRAVVDEAAAQLEIALTTGAQIAESYTSVAVPLLRGRPADIERSAHQTRPTGPPDADATPAGFMTRDPHGSRYKQGRLDRQAEAAESLAKAGYAVTHLPERPGRQSPDYDIEGRIFECYSPTTDDASEVRNLIRDKVRRGQADRMVVNLADTHVTPAEVRRNLRGNPVSGLKEVIIVTTDGTIVPCLP